MRFNERMFEKFKPVFTNLGFDQSKYYEHNGLLDFIKDSDNTVHWVRMTFGLDKKGFVQVKGSITFKDVTNHLKKFDKVKIDFKEEIVVNYDLYKNKEDWTKMYKQFGALSLKTALDIEKFEGEIISHVDSFILPFFEKFPDVQSVNDQIFDKLDFEEFPNYISGNCTLKTLIVMKMCNNPRYEKYKTTKDEEYKFYVSQNPSMWQSSYDSFLALVSYLDNKEVIT